VFGGFKRGASVVSVGRPRLPFMSSLSLRVPPTFFSPGNNPSPGFAIQAKTGTMPPDNCTTTKSFTKRAAQADRAGKNQTSEIAESERSTLSLPTGEQGPRTYAPHRQRPDSVDICENFISESLIVAIVYAQTEQGLTQDVWTDRNLALRIGPLDTHTTRGCLINFRLGVPSCAASASDQRVPL
jgi:hypothetical protein